MFRTDFKDQSGLRGKVLLYCIEQVRNLDPFIVKAREH